MNTRLLKIRASEDFEIRVRGFEIREYEGFKHLCASDNFKSG
jgi:hypothetical protein